MSKAKVLRLIVEDMTADVDRDEGLPFTGANVARSLGEIRAAIVALAGIMESEVSDD